MKRIASEIAATVNEYAPLIARMDERVFAEKKPGKWSKKETLGHLVDSAQNNLQRFIRGQYELVPPVILYQQDSWVELGHYQHYAHHELVQLWQSINLHLCHVLRTMDPAHYEKTCMIANNDLRTLTFFADDYLRHMVHHLNQINS